MSLTPFLFKSVSDTVSRPAYAGSFVAHWLSRALFYDVPWWVFIAAYSAFALLVLGLWVAVPPQRRPRR